LNDVEEAKTEQSKSVDSPTLGKVHHHSSLSILPTKRVRQISQFGRQDESPNKDITVLSSSRDEEPFLNLEWQSLHDHPYVVNGVGVATSPQESKHFAKRATASLRKSEIRAKEFKLVLEEQWSVDEGRSFCEQTKSPIPVEEEQVKRRATTRGNKKRPCKIG